MDHWILNYKKPAEAWYEALPMGNGSIGAISYGRFQNEKIELNLDTLWSGNGRSKLNQNGSADLDYLRNLVLNQRYQEAEEYCREHILGDWTESYLPAGTLHIDMKLPEENAKSYMRRLSLNQAVEKVICAYEDTTYQREVFVSMADPVMAVHYHTEKEQEMLMEISLDSEIQHKTFALDTESLCICGETPTYVAPPYYECQEPIRYSEGEGIRFAMGLHVETPSGNVKIKNNTLQICAKGDIFLYFTGVTDFGRKEDTLNLPEECVKIFRGLEYEKLKASHIEQYQNFFNRMELLLNDSKENHMAEMMFHYARYLMICSSKPGTQCANLQGIWNHSMRAPWSSNYTVNINTEMNYWMAERCNLSECHEPLFELIERTAQNGEKTAREVYGLPGWVSHHNIDIWGHSSPVGYYGQDDNPCSYSMWPMSSGWLCRHLWEHYCYTLDTEFLRNRAYPIVENAVRFYLAYLMPYRGYLVTCPSTSPENQFVASDGTHHSVSVASTMDISILKELFENYLKMCRILKIDGLTGEVKDVLAKLPPFQIGEKGQLQEWFFDYPEAEEHHRHVSHLYGLYPAQIIDREDKDLREACQKSLDLRGDEGTGWCMAWKACLWARLNDGEHALKLLKNQLRYTTEENISCVGGGIYPNMLCAHPPFQIDGNFGFAAAMIEMLIQSKGNEVTLLPALPKEWNTGKVTGVQIQGGFTVDFEWEKMKIKNICIRAKYNSELLLNYNGKTERIHFEPGSIKKM